jgi:hypothetical protein
MCVCVCVCVCVRGCKIKNTVSYSKNRGSLIKVSQRMAVAVLQYGPEYWTLTEQYRVRLRRLKWKFISCCRASVILP